MLRCVAFLESESSARALAFEAGSITMHGPLWIAVALSADSVLFHRSPALDTPTILVIDASVTCGHHSTVLTSLVRESESDEVQMHFRSHTGRWVRDGVWLEMSCIV